MSKLQTWQGVQDQLEATRTSLNEQIAVYPGPITGCDAQFNHLLGQRTNLNQQLVLLGQLSEDTDASNLTKFVEACPFLVGSNGEKQQ
jgi:hypothetical protein